MNSIKKILTLLTFIILFHGILYSQSQKEDTTAISIYETPAYCIRFCGGVGFTSLFYGYITFLRVDIKNVFISVRYAGAFDIFYSSSGFSPFIKDVSVIAGYSYTKEDFYASIGTGICQVRSNTKQLIGTTLNPWAYQEITNYCIGVPVQIDLMGTPGKMIGLGFVFYGNINKNKSFCGAALCIQFGKLR